MYSVGEHVWVDREAAEGLQVPKGCSILKIDKRKIQVQDDDNNVEWITPERIVRPIHVSQIDPVNDMIHLGDLQDCSILRNLHKRYKNQMIYTYIGDMLIALNPYQVLNIYSANEVSMYSEARLDTLPPHIFATSSKCFAKMRSTRQNQCILISGESGAGKTESTKLILQYLTTISAGGHSWIKQQILETNPILEAFGNAKTQRNDNSSRFGKYINIHFNDNGEIEGAQIEYYLLEKSRIVMQAKTERNYHIFYSLFAGLSNDEKHKLNLGKVSDYRYLQGVSTCKGRNDAQTFADIKAAMRILNHDDETFSNIIRLLVTILSLGNLKYKAITIAHADATEIHDDVWLKNVCAFLGVSKAVLVSFLTKRCIFIQGEKVVSNLSPNQAQEVRDSLSKLIYEKIFEKIIAGINKTIHNSKKRPKNTIGVLDISGFENFECNSFEQLCINYTNEHLQQYFVQHIFKLEQQNYAAEGIVWRSIEFSDNQEIIDLIGAKPLNIMSLIDEESIFPKGSDSSLLSKISLIHANNRHFAKPKSILSKEFGIAHYAGNVSYDVTGFLDKNRDHFSGDFGQLLAGSSNEFFRRLFAKSELPAAGDFGKKSTTLSIKFRESLESLLNALGACNPFFIRCIKPNENQMPQVFDKVLCYRQLRYLGLLETAKIRQAGYPQRYEFADFVERYAALAWGVEPSRRSDKKYMVEKICANVLGASKDGYQFGRNKVFLKDHHHATLEGERRKALCKYAVVLQKNLRMWVYRKRFLKARKAAIVIQRVWRGHRPRKNFVSMKKAILRLQLRIRSRREEADFRRKRKFIISFQAMCRRYLALKYCKEKREQLKIKKIQAAHSHTNRDSKYANNDSESHSIDTAFDFLNNEPVNVVQRKISNELYVDVTARNSIKAPSEVSDTDILTYDFCKFAAIYFTGNANPYFAKKPLNRSLLDLPHLSDQLAAKAVSITIFRFMGDYPESENQSENNTKTVMSTVNETLSKNFIKTQNYNKIIEEGDHHIMRMTLRKKNKFSNVITEGIVNDEYETWLNTKSSNLEKLHFIIGHGILRPELKDEIYCQIVKQLINNPSKSSYNKGWVLLSLCIGCFAPSDKFINYLKSFIKTGPVEYAPLCAKRLMRTYENGSRTQPPCWIEIQSVKHKQPISLKVSFANGNSKIIQADSASTAQEIVHSLAESIKLRDTFGFSLFITIDDKVLSLGSDRDHVMDAISQCEQYAMEQGHSERDERWRLLFRKEIFAPWHEPTVDEVATNLIYHQICNSVKSGEYRFNNENDLATIIAQQFYVQYHTKSLPQNLKSILHTYVPNHLLRGNFSQVLSRLETQIVQIYKRRFGTIDYNSMVVKEDVVTYAKNSWPLLFSKLYEVNKIFGPEFQVPELIIAVNSAGVFFIDDNEKILLQLSFAEISEVNYQKNENTLLHNLTISTIQREEFVFQSYNAESFVSLVNYIIDYLKKRSVYVVAVQDYINNEGSDTTLVLRKGDIIKLTDGYTGEKIITSLWASGDRNGSRIKFPCEYVYVLPILSKPSTKLAEMFKSDFKSKVANPVIQELNQNLKEMKCHNLKKFASENFRAVVRTASTSGILAIKGSASGELWKHTREPMKSPLLAALANRVEQSQLAVKMFKTILRYMGDLPSNKQPIGTEYTDDIFEPALENSLLRDELYCQIMRQLTSNKVRLSEERGWELMWLATGIMSCSSKVRKELELFLSSRENTVSQDCIARLHRIVKTGTNRMYPPYILEVEAIRFKNLQIFHKIYFPDDTDAAFEVHSSTRALDLCDEIAKKLQLRSSKGFSLYFKINERMISVPQHYFFFDFVRDIINLHEDTPSQPSSQTTYRVLFLRKIWIDCLPGRDRNADLKFHFYQEATKYLRGFFKCSIDEAIKLAALIYVNGHADNKEELSQIHLKLNEYVPADMIHLLHVKKWKKYITEAYPQYKHISQDEAKMKFLQHVYQWPTFGSSFFEARQTIDPKLPERLLVAINKNGVSIIKPDGKDTVAAYSFKEITSWSSGDTFFHMTIGNFMGGRKILCETTMGYKMDDLISSYIDYLNLGNNRAAAYG